MTANPEPLDLEPIKRTINREPGSDQPNYHQLRALVAEVERLREPLEQAERRRIEAERESMLPGYHP